MSLRKKGAPKGGGEMGEYPVSGAVRTHVQHLLMKSSVFIWAWFVVSQNSYNGNIKDCWSQITLPNIIIVKKLEIVQELQKSDMDIEWVNAVGKMALIDVQCRVAPNLQFVEKKKYSLWSTIKQSVIKWGIPVVEFYFM